MAVSVYDRTFLSDEQQKKLAELTKEWNRANASGDEAGMRAAHQAAEDVRSAAGYSGGTQGTDYTKLSALEGGYSAAQLPSYKAQTEAVNDVYDAYDQLQLAQLKSAYEKSAAELDARRAKIPDTYNQQRNSASAQSEIAKSAWGEYAAGSGLNSGASGQAELSRRNALQGELAALDRSEAEAISEAELAAAELMTDYQNKVAEAIAKGEYERAQALLEEYRAQESSSASTAREQADENYRAWAARRSAEDEAYDRARDEEQTAYDRELEAQKLQYQREQDALEAERYDDERAYQREQDALERARAEASLAYSSGQAQASADLSAAENRAKTLAKYGDFSGYSSLGYSDEEIANMRAIWEAQNPELVMKGALDDVLKRYPDGVVTDTSEWLALRDQYGEEELAKAGISLDPESYMEQTEGVPKTFEEFVRATGRGDIMTWDEFRKTEKGYTDMRDYEKYLARMYSIYGSEAAKGG